MHIYRAIHKDERNAEPKDQGEIQMHQRASFSWAAYPLYVLIGACFSIKALLKLDILQHLLRQMK